MKLTSLLEMTFVRILRMGEKENLDRAEKSRWEEEIWTQTNAKQVNEESIWKFPQQLFQKRRICHLPTFCSGVYDIPRPLCISKLVWSCLACSLEMFFTYSKHIWSTKKTFVFPYNRERLIFLFIDASRVGNKKNWR